MPRPAFKWASHRQRFAAVFAVALLCLSAVLVVSGSMSGAQAAEAPPVPTMDHGGGTHAGSEMPSPAVPQGEDPVAADSNGPSGEHGGHTPGMNMDQTVTSEAVDADAWTAARSAVLITFAAINIGVLIAAGVARARRRPPRGRRRAPATGRGDAGGSGRKAGIPEVAR